MTVSKEELLTGLRETESEVLGQLKSMTRDQLDIGRYENGWNAREILAHVASIEWTYPKLIDIARNGPKPPKPRSEAASQDEGRPAILSYNDRQVAKRANATVDELIAEFETNRQATIKAVKETDDDLMAKEVTSAGGFNGPLAQVLWWVAVDHVRSHLKDIVEEPS